MDLLLELRESIRAYVEGRHSIDHVRDWLTEHVQVVHETSEPLLQQLDGLAWTLIAEYDRGHRDDEDVRQAFAWFEQRDPILRKFWNFSDREEQATTTSADNRMPPPSYFPVRITEPGAVVQWLVGTRPAVVLA